jgi:hypothetical protein
VERRVPWRQFWLMAALLALAGCGGASSTAVARHAPPKATATPTATPIPFQRPNFQAGMVFPRWGTTVYGATDTAWNQGVLDIKRQTGARWIEIVVTLYQDTLTSTTVHASDGTPTPDAVAAGILTAKEAGFHVFVVPHLLILQPGVKDSWGGWVNFSDPNQASAWFDGYWAALQPYLALAAETGADQFAMGNELIGLEPAPATLWNTLISRAHAVFPGVLTYNTNWSSLAGPPPGWMSNPLLSYIGISAYQSLVSQPQSLSAAQIEQVWRSQFLPLIDAYGAGTHKPILLSEIGYRNSTDTLYQPWVHSTSAPADPTLQAAAYEGALRAALGDQHIEGIYFYAWSNDEFAPNNLPAAAVLHQIYLSPAA